MPAGFTRGRAVAGPPLFVPSAARYEMTRDGYRLLVRLRGMHRSIGPAEPYGFTPNAAALRQRKMNFEYLLRPCHRERHVIRSCWVMIGKKTPHCTLNVGC